MFDIGAPVLKRCTGAPPCLDYSPDADPLYDFVPRGCTAEVTVCCFIVAVEAESGAAVLVIEEPWTPADGKAPNLRSPGVDTAPLIDSAPQTEAAVTWSK
jgi:hypothetical protein